MPFLVFYFVVNYFIATMFVYAYGYDWNKGAEESKRNYPVRLVLRRVQDGEAFKKK